MRKFIVLLNKEIREMLTVEVIAPLILTAVVFFFLGNILTKEQASSNKPVEINVINQDKTVESESLLALLDQAKIKSTIINSKNIEDGITQTKKDKKSALLEIPEGFGANLGSNEALSIDTYTIVNNFSALGNQNYTVLAAGLTGANNAFSDQLIKNKSGSDNPEFLKNPIRTSDSIVIGDRHAQVNMTTIMGFVSQQTIFIPLIIFSVIFFAVQMIAIAIASEKENKTLETLLTTPVDRKSIVYSKMAAAGFIALVASGIYILGFRSYIQGLFSGSEIPASVTESIKYLGLSLTWKSYLLLGLSMFAGILAALSVAFNLGAFAKDVKSVAGLISPLTVLIMTPYLLTMFLDINSVSPVLRYILYAIPFTHIFMAAPNLFLHRYDLVIYGIIYELTWFVGFSYLAIRIFSSEKILIMKLNLFSKNGLLASLLFKKTKP